MATYLIGGLLLLCTLLSLIDPCKVLMPSTKDMLSFYGAFAVIFMSIPAGYIVNQLWMTLYNMCFDFHTNISNGKTDSDKSESKAIRSCRWKLKYLNEAKLALIHRMSTQTNIEEILKWHRNRINELHSNGTVAFSLILGFILCLLISSFSESEFLLRPLPVYFSKRWWVVLIIVIVAFNSILRFYRCRKMIVFYNEEFIKEEEKKEEKENQSAVDPRGKPLRSKKSQRNSKTVSHYPKKKEK